MLELVIIFGFLFSFMAGWYLIDRISKLERLNDKLTQSLETLRWKIHNEIGHEKTKTESYFNALLDKDLPEYLKKSGGKLIGMSYTMSGQIEYRFEVDYSFEDVYILRSELEKELLKICCKSNKKSKK